MQRCLNRLTSSVTMVLQRALILTCEAPHPSSILGKVASGLCSDLLTCVLRAWDFAREKTGKRKKLVLLVLKMNTPMWRGNSTRAYITARS